MKICCVCGKKWKDTNKDKSIKPKMAIYGCEVCKKGYYKKYSSLNYFKFGYMIKKD